MKQVSTEQIQQLHTFVRGKRVRYYDLELELVDHLASSIEEQWITNPERTFEQALENSYRTFGVTGFGGIVQSREQESVTASYKASLTFCKAYLQPLRFLPRLAAACLLAWLLQSVKWVEIGLVVVSISIFVYNVVYRLIPFQKLKKSLSKDILSLKPLEQTVTNILEKELIGLQILLFLTLADDNNLTFWESLFSFLVIIASIDISIWGQKAQKQYENHVLCWKNRISGQ